MSPFWAKVRRDFAPILLALVITGGYFYALNYLAGHSLPVESREAVLSMIDALKTVWILAMGYFYGTTAGSSQKTEIIAKSNPVDPQ